MPEFNSRQKTTAAGSGLTTDRVFVNSYGTKRTIVITSPATAAWAQNDTLASGIFLPVGTRFLASSIASHAAFGSSVTLEVGIRDVNGTAIDADGIAAAVSIASAGRTAINNGDLVAAGVESTTTQVAEIYATLTGANPTDNAQIRLEIDVLLPA